MGLVIQGCKTRPFPFFCAHCLGAQNCAPCQPRDGNAKCPSEGSGMHRTHIIFLRCFLCHRGWRSNVPLIVENKNLYLCLLKKSPQICAIKIYFGQLEECECVGLRCLRSLAGSRDLRRMWSGDLVPRPALGGTSPCDALWRQTQVIHT